MGSVRIRIRDFEIIKKADFVVSGLTGLVGETNQGKSSTVRAIMYSLLNRSGREYLRHGCKKTTVGMQFKGFSEHKDFGFVWTKAQSANYKLSDGTVLEKTGRTLPVEVGEGTGIFPVDLDKDLLLVNFLTQLDPPLLRDLSESRMYNMIVKSLDGDRLQEALTMAKADSDEFNMEISEATIELGLTQKRLLSLRDREAALSAIVPLKKAYQTNLLTETRLKVVKQRRDQFAYLGVDVLNATNQMCMIDDALKDEAAVLNLLAMIRTRDDAAAARKNINNANNAILVAESQISSIDAVLSVVPDLAKPEKFHHKIGQARTQKKSLDEKTAEIADLTRNIHDIDAALVGSEKVAVLQKGTLKLARLIAHRDSYREAVKNYESFNSSFVDVSTTLDDIENMINKGTCPVCRTSVGEDKMDLKQVQQNIEELKNRKASMSGRLESLKEQKERVAEEIRVQGIDPENLDAEIKKMQKKIDTFQTKLAPIVEKINEALAELDGDPASTASAVGSSDDFSFGG